LFQGFRNNAQIRQARLNVQRSSLELQNSTSQLAVAEDNYSTALQNLSAAREQVKASRSYFNLMEKAYQQGVNSLIEFIDARNQLTASELQLNLRQYELLTAAAQLERETSSFNLPQ
jgi:outer membrane protein TolC